jgi:hypothetical protein
MPWDVEYTDEFGDWWASLTQDEQASLAASVQLLEVNVPIADRLYDQHLVQLRREGAIDG